MSDDKAPALSPARILEVALGFQASKALLAAVELQLFTHLGSEKLTGEQLGAKGNFDKRGRADLLDALVALGFLGREGSGLSTVYFNTPETAAFLDRASPSYVGGALELIGGVPFRMWTHLTDVLRTGATPSDVRAAGKAVYDGLYGSEPALESYLGALATVHREDFRALTTAFDFGRYKSVCDVGGALGDLSIEVARQHPGVSCVTLDLPPVEPIATRRIAAAGLSDRVRAVAGDFFKDDLPKADVIVMAEVLCDWGSDDRMKLIEKVRASLPDGGAFIAIEELIEDDRSGSARALLWSLNQTLLTGGGGEFTHAEFDEWCREAGFRSTSVLRLTKRASAVIAYA